MAYDVSKRSGEMSEVEVIAEVGSIEARGLLSGPLQQFCDVGSDPPRLVAAVRAVPACRRGGPPSPPPAEGSSSPAPPELGASARAKTQSETGRMLKAWGSWTDRGSDGSQAKTAAERVDELSICFRDPDGHLLELATACGRDIKVSAHIPS